MDSVGANTKTFLFMFFVNSCMDSVFNRILSELEVALGFKGYAVLKRIIGITVEALIVTCLKYEKYKLFETMMRGMDERGFADNVEITYVNDGAYAVIVTLPSPKLTPKDFVANFDKTYGNTTYSDALLCEVIETHGSIYIIVKVLNSLIYDVITTDLENCGFEIIHEDSGFICAFAHLSN